METSKRKLVAVGKWTKKTGWVYFILEKEVIEK